MDTKGTKREEKGHGEKTNPYLAFPLANGKGKVWMVEKSKGKEI